VAGFPAAKSVAAEGTQGTGVGPSGRERHLADRPVHRSGATQAVPPALWRRTAASPWFASAAAAGLLIATGLALAWGLEKDRRLRQELQPHAGGALIDLAPLGSERSGPQSVVLPIAGPSPGAFLILNPAEPLPGGDYEARILDAGGRPVWRGPVQPNEFESFSLEVPGGFLVPGPYRIEVVSKGTGEEVLIGRYAVKVAEGPPADAGSDSPK
jgi:hypothetical protein